MGAGLTIIGSILVCALVGGVLCWPLGVALPIALAGSAVGLVFGFYAVWLRYFRRP